MLEDMYLYSSQLQVPTEPQVPWKELKYYLALESEVEHHVVVMVSVPCDVRNSPRKDHSIKLKYFRNH